MNSPGVDDSDQGTAGQNALLLVVSILVGLLVLEGVARWHLSSKARGWAEVMQSERHYLRRSDNPVLGYEHVPGKVVVADGQRLAINAYGIRADSNDLFPDRERIALLGDSVTFGVLKSQEQTLSVLLEDVLRARGRDAAVINLGTGGYGLNELAEYLPLKHETYRLDACIYIFNPNDFARRGSIYEGGDNGAYRMYYPPTFAAGWMLVKMLRKALGINADAVPWYRYIYRGNRDNGFDRLGAIVDFAAAEGIRLAVVLMPSGYAYAGDEYLLDEQYREIQRFLSQRGVASFFPREQFGADPARFIDRTDHLHPAGDRVMIDVLLDAADAVAPAVPSPADGGGRTAAITKTAFAP